MDRNKDDEKVGWGRRVDARFATPASRNILGQSTTPLSLEHTFIGRALGKGSCLESIQGSSREPSVGPKRDEFSEALAFPPAADNRASEDEAATQLDEDNQENATLFPPRLTLKRDTQSRTDQGKGTQLCHSCGEALPYEEHCGICGHDYCYKCACERWKADAGTWIDNSGPAVRTKTWIKRPDTTVGVGYLAPATIAKAIPRTPTRGLVAGNPFILADRYSKGTLSAPPKATTNGFGSRPRRLSECVSRRFLGEMPINVTSRKPKNHQDPRKHEPLQDIERHSLCCSARMRPMTMNRNEADGGLKDDDDDDALRSKIAKLCRHAEEFHKSQNTLGHNDTGFEYRPPRKSSMTQTSVTSVAEEAPTPTRPPRRLRLPSLTRDGEKDGASTAEAGHTFQHAAAEEKVEGVGLGHAHDVAPLEHGRPTSRAVSKTSSSSSIRATERPEDTKETGKQESGMRPQPLILRPKNVDVVDSSVSKSSPGRDVLDTKKGPTDVLPAATSVGNDLPSLTGYRRHRQNTYLCPKAQTSETEPEPEPEPWPFLRKVDAPRRTEQPLTQTLAPWSQQALRRVSSALGCLHPPVENIDSPVSPRSKGGAGHGAGRGGGGAADVAPSKMIAAATPMADWRRKLVKPGDGAANAPQMDVGCESCERTDSRRPASPIDGSVDCSRRSNSLVRSVKDNDANLEDPFTEPRLSIRAIEKSLAWKKVQDDLEKEISSAEAKKGSTSPRPSRTTASNKSAGETAPSGCPPSCSWRSRYLRLRDEIIMSDDLLALCERGCVWKGNEAPGRCEGSAADELGIEALTVVVHMRDRDNLVIKTDLTSRQHERDEGREADGRVRE
ncbi:hypothetical protein E4U42_007607 [Claviceps africana]|uniref:Uncharacterized protein n=1 Tax=Claviceps africana TaxID=83212 RepID=A0A8K0NG32_9HYPO|nr:hypothetical protein E4U42_007607 [Claviceps africana]